MHKKGKKKTKERTGITRSVTRRSRIRREEEEESDG